MVLLRIALNNLVRNRRRTVATLISVIFGISIMVFANGYSDGFASQWGRLLIDETQGHFIVRHKEFRKYERTDLARIYLKDTSPIIELIKANQQVIEVMPRVVTGGIISKGEKSSVFVSWFNHLEEINTALPGHGSKVIKGQPLSGDDPDGVVLGEKLARNMGASIGDELVLMSNSVRGDRNAVLVHVRGIKEFRTNSEMESNFMVAGLSEQIRNDLLEIGDGATELVVRIEAESELEDVIDTLNSAFEKAGYPLEAVPWHAEEAFQVVTHMYKGLGFVNMIILSMLVSFVVSNSMMISIYERTREIGTMRAVGLKKRQVFLMSYYEFTIIMVVGAVLGLLLGASFVGIGAQTGVTISEGVQVVRPVLAITNLVVSTLFPFIIAAIFVTFTIRAGNRLQITEMLK